MKDKNFKLIKTLNIHDGPILCLVLYKHYLITGSADTSIKIVNLNSYNITKIIDKHDDWVNCLRIINNKYLISGGTDSIINIYDINNNYQCIHTLHDFTGLPIVKHF